ncbi:uncharacterized protein LOC114752371 [Neltuma alba]|uniref:uncharacterized protein LOC114732073 n=1 Tax=Neltuma alba TaxID=207710 RepID=UPI0010A2D909|nr:uncharacterized protein LOC114732073 [Prosopis alba]XP_028796954.1 uncharacterized protein LOC114752371 [Prosopis alba]
MGEKRFLLRLFISVKHITANVMDESNGRIVATASTVEHAIKDAFDPRASASAIGEVLAMRLKAEGLGSGARIDAAKEIENKELHTCPKARAIVNAMRSRGLHIVLPHHDGSSP